MAQHGVGFRRTIAAHDPDRLVGAVFALHFPHQIDQVRIHVGLLALAPVAQEPVQLVERGLVVTPSRLKVMVMSSSVWMWCIVMVRVSPSATAFCSARDAEQESKQGETARIAGARRKEYKSFQARLPNRHWPSHIDALGEQPAAAPATTGNANAMLIWEGLTRTYATPPPTPKATGRVWQKMAVIGRPAQVVQVRSRQAGCMVNGPSFLAKFHSPNVRPAPGTGLFLARVSRPGAVGWSRRRCGRQRRQTAAKTSYRR